MSTHATNVSSTLTPRPQLDAQWIIDNLVDRDQFEPCPHPSRDPQAWAALAQTTGKCYIDWAEENLHYEYPPIKASQLMAYGRTQNRVAMEKPYFDRRYALQNFIMAECLTGLTGKYMDQIVDGIWTICEEAYWCFPPHMGAGAQNLLPDLDDPILDLFAGQTGQQMAWLVWLLRDQLDTVSPEIIKQIKRKTRYFVLDAIINHPRHWMGLDPDRIMNNWTPWICSTWLSAVWMFEDDIAKRDKAIGWICNALNIFIKQQPEDGGCDEGVMYWGQAGAALYESLDLLGGMVGQGKALFMDHPLLANLAHYPQVMHVKDAEFVCFADGRAIAKSMPGYWISKWADALGDESMLAFGDQQTRMQLATPRPHHTNFYRLIQRPFLEAKLLENEPLKLTGKLDEYLPDIEVVTMRSTEELGQGWHVSAKGGHNAESHNHNDIGQVVVYHDGHPLLIDLGVETYSGKTFSDRRYEIFTMQSQWHNLPSFGDAVQLPGREFAAKSLKHAVNGRCTTFDVDIANAYDPKANLHSYQRQVKLDRDADGVTVTDHWQCSQSMPMTLSLVTLSKVQVDGQKLILTPVNLPDDRMSASATITIENATVQQIQVEEKELADPILRESWGTLAYRILMTFPAATSGALQLTIQHR
jgi:hypothetical protein